MRIDTIFTPVEACSERMVGRSVAVIDVFRATSCICTAIENGATRLIPYTTIEDSLLMRDKLTECGERVLLGGERKTVIIEGFDLDNSPRKYTREVVQGATIVMTTTNGTRSIECAVRYAEQVFIASLLNASAAAEALVRSGRDIVLFCSGRHDNFTIEDVLCAGMIASIIEKNYTCELSDSAWVALDIYGRYQDDLRVALRHCFHYNHIIDNGLKDDVDYCLQRDIFSTAPVVCDRAIVGQ